MEWGPAEQPSYLYEGFSVPRLPSLQMYSPTTIISIETCTKLAETTTFILSLKQGVEKQPKPPPPPSFSRTQTSMQQQ
jgi:hypothetical protein